MTGTLNVVTALPAEAKPLIGHFELHSSDTEPFRMYTNGYRSIRLIVSGVGKVAAAGAVTHLAEEGTPKDSPAWLNVGVAGHRSLPLGTLVAAHKVTDDGTGRSWYPPLILDLPCETASLLTVEKEANDYPDNALVEMEAAGFYAAASQLSPHELIHCLKVVSDNRSEKKLDGRSVTEMIAAQLEAVESVAHPLRRLSEELGGRRAASPYSVQFLDRWKFTVTQSHQLEKLLKRWEVIFPETDPFEAAGIEIKDSRAALQFLRNRLNEAPVEAAQL